MGAALFLAGCYRGHLYVQQEWVDRNFLASTHVGTPDPRQCEPMEGQRLLIAWDFPRSLYSCGLTLLATVRFWDEKEEVRTIPLVRRRGAEAFFFPGEKILTYRVDVVASNGEVIESWLHQFWIELIDVGKSKSSSVSSQPMHESVIERP